MKRAWFVTLGLIVVLGLSLISPASPAPKASAIAPDQCTVKSGGGVELCTVVMVQLSGSGAGVANLTVTAHPVGSNISFTLSNAAQEGISPAVIGNAPLNKPLPANAYTSFFGIPGTDGAPGGGCASNATNNNAHYTFSVSGTGVNTATSSEVNLCASAGGSSNPGLATVPISVSSKSKPGNTGSFRGATSYSGNGKSGKCYSPGSYVEIWGGPKNIAQNKAVQVNVDPSGNYQSPSNLAVGSGYTISIHCYDAARNTGAVNLYQRTLTNQTLKAGTTTVDLKNIGPVGDDPGSSPPSESDKGGTDDPTCGTNQSSWICEIIMSAVKPATSALDGFVNNALNVDTKDIFGATDTDVTKVGTDANGYYVAWNSFRVLAIAILVIAGLVMVASQALGFEFLDAYTVRKVLPRLVIAVIGISLSWVILKFITQFFDDIGFAVRSLIYGPFSHLTANVNGSSYSFGSLTTAAVVGIVAFSVLQVGGVISFLITAFLALLVAFLVLVLRQVVIILLIITAPVAIAMYILPNTEKGWKIWRETFFGAMLMFPIISAFIAAGHAFAMVSFARGSGTSNTLYQIIGWVAWFLPYFLLPLTFRLATGAVGTIAGFVNDRSRGGFDRLKKGRAERMQRNLAGMAAGTRYNNRTLNALTSRATTRGFGLTKRGKEAYQQKLTLAGGEFGKSAQGQAVQYNDGALRAMTYGSAVEAKAKMARDWKKADGTTMSDAEIDTAIEAVKASGGFGRSRQIYAAQQLVATKTGYDDLQQVGATIARVSNGNDSQMAALAGNMNSTAKAVGRGDLAPGYGGLVTLAQAETAGRATPEMYLDQSRKASGSVDAVSAMRGNTAGVRNNVNTLQRQIQTSPTDADATAQLHDLINAYSYGPRPNQAELERILYERGENGQYKIAPNEFREHLERVKRSAEVGRSPDEYSRRIGENGGPAGPAAPAE